MPNFRGRYLEIYARAQASFLTQDPQERILMGNELKNRLPRPLYFGIKIMGLIIHLFVLEFGAKF